jgi:hypothetical protein
VFNATYHNVCSSTHNPLRENAEALQRRLAQFIGVGLNGVGVLDDSDSVSLARVFDNFTAELEQCRDDAEHVGKLLQTHRRALKCQRELNSALDETEQVLLCTVSPVVDQLVYGLELEQTNHLRTDAQQVVYGQAKQRAGALLHKAKAAIQNARVQVQCVSQFTQL